MNATRQRPEPTHGYQDIFHPLTKRFMFALDARRGIARVKDNGQDAFIDLAQYGWVCEDVNIDSQPSCK